MTSTLHDRLRTAAEQRGDSVALRFLDEELTFAQLDRRVDGLARALIDLGIGPSDRVLIAASLRPDVIVAQYAVSSVGAAFVMTNPAWQDDEVAHALRLTEPSAVLADLPTAASGNFASIKHRVCLDDAAPGGWHASADLVSCAAGSPPYESASDPMRDVALVFSSGTTGMPKAVRHSHVSLLANVDAWTAAAAIDESDRLQLFLPLFHTYGIVTVATAISARSSLRLIPAFDLDTVLDNIVDERITIIFGATPVFAGLASRVDLGSFDLSSLRYAVWGATPIVAATAAALSQRTGMRWLAAYGASEAPVLCSTPVLSGDDPHLGTAGRAVSGVELRIVDLDTGELVPPGASGEIQARGSQVMLGYLPQGANLEAFDDTWLRTGDIGWQDDDGWLHITDRVKEMLKVSAFQVAPVELERVLFRHPAVADCAVYGLPDDRLGELPKAAVVLAAGASLTEDEVISWFEPQLARYKRLRAVAFVDHIPRTASGKVLRRVLRDADLAALDSQTTTT
ncbi:AMP-binding protein [Aeromicrobium panaciterrae]|uniref:class I adenylate-forming enzyme family protein n=1 Tax=Aeromicrobium panaciterrae TaxID=363861 RepID=UPI0031D207EA